MTSFYRTVAKATQATQLMKCGNSFLAATWRGPDNLFPGRVAPILYV